MNAIIKKQQPGIVAVGFASIIIFMQTVIASDMPLHDDNAYNQWFEDWYNRKGKLNLNEKPDPWKLDNRIVSEYHAKKMAIEKERAAIRSKIEYRTKLRTAREALKRDYTRNGVRVIMRMGFQTAEKTKSILNPASTVVGLAVDATEFIVQTVDKKVLA